MDENNIQKELTEEGAVAAIAILNEPDYDQEGLILTGGYWFYTIRQAPKNNKETKKERKKAKISQTSIQSSADLGPGLLQKDCPRRPAPLAFTPPPPTIINILK